MGTCKAFELLHMDLFGPTTYTSIGGNKYGFVTVDDFTIYTWAFESPSLVLVINDTKLLMPCV